MDDVEEISPAKLKERLASGARPVLIDVRLAWEHQLVSLEGSRLVPLHLLSEQLEEIRPELEGKAVVVYCHHGVRSLTGAAILKSAGIDALSLEGGIDAWAATIDPSLPRY